VLRRALRFGNHGQSACRCSALAASLGLRHRELSAPARQGVSAALSSPHRL